MAGLQMSGLASGLDTQSIIAQLMAVERIPRQRMERAQGAVQQRQDHLREIQTKLKALKTAASDLQSGGLWNPVKTASSADTAKVGARVLTPSAAALGTYDINVTQLATKETEKWSIMSQATSSNLRIRDTASGVNYDYTIAANATVDQIVSTINGRSDSTVVASKDPDDGKLVLTAKVTGTPGAFTVTNAPNDVLVSRDYNAAAVNASYTINGAAKTSTSNTDTASIAGVELNLQGLTAGTHVTVTVAETPADKAAVAAKFKAFVEAYNAVVDFTRGKITEKSDPKAATVTDAKKGVLYGDSGLTTILSNLRNGLMNPLTGAGNAATMDEMHEIGLSTGSAVSTLDPGKVAGRLTFDEAKFNKAWDADRASVERLIRGDGTVTGQGFTQRMDSMLKGMTDVGGLLDGRINGAGSELKTLASRLANMDRRLEKKEEFYKRQFTALETALSRSQSIQQQLAGQLAGLPQAGGK